MAHATMERMTMTPQQLFERAQHEAIPRHDLTPFRGMWVAVRRGRVVAAEIDAGVLRRDEAVRDDDVLLAVPSDDDAILIV